MQNIICKIKNTKNNSQDNVSSNVKNVIENISETEKKKKFMRV